MPERSQPVTRYREDQIADGEGVALTGGKGTSTMDHCQRKGGYYGPQEIESRIFALISESSITRWPTSVRANTRDVTHSAPISRARAHPPPIEDAAKDRKPDATRVIHPSGLDTPLDIPCKPSAKDQTLSTDRVGRAKNNRPSFKTSENTTTITRARSNMPASCQIC